MLSRFDSAARRLARLLDAPLDELEVAEHELGLHELHVGLRIDGVAHMSDFLVRKGADHVRDGVHPADVGEETVTQPFAVAGAFREAGDVDDVYGGVDLVGCLQYLVQPVEPCVGDGDHIER